MTNEKMLRSYIQNSGFKMRFIANKLGVSYQCLLNKLTNESEFKQSEIVILCDLLKIDQNDREEIFFGKIA